MKQAWHALPIDEVLLTLHTHEQHGLTTEEATARRAMYGSNELPMAKPARWWQLLLRQFFSPLIYILVLSAMFTTWLGEWIDTTVIVISVIVNVVIGFFQEYRASNILEALKKIVRIEALVLRGGQPTVVDAAELVPGDIILLKLGAKVPADARLLHVRHLETNEAILTGESAAVKKVLGDVVETTALADRNNMVWFGTTVEAGEATAVVVSTGRATQLGVIAALTASATEEVTPLQVRLKRLANMISLVVLISAAIIFGIGLLRHLSLIEVFTTAVAVAVSAIPEGLVAALSVVLAVGTSRILKAKGLVRRPVAAETLGSVSVICTDKTGTITEGVMKVERFLPDGPEDMALLTLLLANEAVVEERADQIPLVHGEATDRAKLEYAITHGVDHTKALQRYPKLDLLPFDQAGKYIAAFHGEPEKSKAMHVFVSGAPELLLTRCAYHGDGRPLTEEEKAAIVTEQEKLASKGYRLIGLADRVLPTRVDTDNDEALRASLTDLTFRGLVALRDPIRHDVAATLTLTRQAGIRAIMVTGDHRTTAMAIGQELGFRTNDENVLDGAAIDQLTDEQLRQVITTVDICSRVNPEHKLRIVRALIANGESVAMTGDGVNDAPALKAADVGVATQSATDVTKEAADLVLLDDGLATIVRAVQEGRVSFDNIRKVTVLLLSGSFTAFILVLTSLVLGVPLPLTAVQILWGNVVENGLPNFALAFEPAEGDVMARPPISRKTSILGDVGVWVVFGIAPLRDVLLVGVYLWLLTQPGADMVHIRTLIFALLSTDSLFYIFSVKSFHQAIWHENFFDNWYLLGSIMVGLVMVLAAIYLPIFNLFLGTIPLSLADMAFVVGFALLDVVLIETVKAFYRHHKRVATA